MTDFTITIPASAMPWLWFALGYVCGFLSLMLLALWVNRKPKAKKI